MKSYTPSTPRVALAMVAVAMAAITIGLMVVLPADLESGSIDPSMLVATAKPMLDLQGRNFNTSKRANEIRVQAQERS
jgi:hypothetical protein